MTHTLTPWAVDEYHSVIGPDGKNICANGFSSIMSYGPSMLDARANAAYIVHCVNSHASLVEENKRMRAKLGTIEALIGNVDHSRGGGENTARMYGEMLNDIRAIAGDDNA